MTGGPATNREELATNWEELATNREELATNWEELATNWEELATNRGVLRPNPPGLATNLGRAGPTRRGAAAQAKRLQAAAMKVVRPPGPKELEGLVVPQVRPFRTTYYKACGQAGSSARLSAARASSAGAPSIGSLRWPLGTGPLPRGLLRWRRGRPRVNVQLVPRRPTACTGANRAGRLS